MSFLIDTDICAAHLKQNGEVTSRFLQYGGGLHLSTISLGELTTWALRRNAPPKRLQGLHDMLSDMNVLDVTTDVARMFGRLQAELLDIGRPAPGMDLMIAVTAVFHNLTLVTRNIADFANVPGLRMTDWLGH